MSIATDVLRNIFDTRRENRVLSLLGERGKGGYVANEGLLANGMTDAEPIMASEQNVAEIPQGQGLEGVETVYTGGAMTPTLTDPRTQTVSPASYDQNAGGTGVYSQNPVERQEAINKINVVNHEAGRSLMGMYLGGGGGGGGGGGFEPWKQVQLDIGDGTVRPGVLGKGGRMMLSGDNGFAQAPQGSKVVNPAKAPGQGKDKYTNYNPAIVNGKQVMTAFDRETKKQVIVPSDITDQVMPEFYQAPSVAKTADNQLVFANPTEGTLTAPTIEQQLQPQQPQQTITKWGQIGRENSLQDAPLNAGKNAIERSQIAWKESREKAAGIRSATTKGRKLLSDLKAIQQLSGELPASLSGKVAIGAGNILSAVGALSPDEEKSLARWNAARAKEMKLMPLFKNDESGKNQYQGAMQQKEWEMLLASIGMLSGTPESRKYMVRFQQLAQDNLDKYSKAAAEYSKAGGDMALFDEKYQASLDPAADGMTQLLADINNEVGAVGGYEEPADDFKKRLYGE